MYLTFFYLQKVKYDYLCINLNITTGWVWDHDQSVIVARNKYKTDCSE